MTVVVVTGGTRGIGQGLVHAFLAEGAQVAYCGRTSPEKTVEGALFIQADVTQREDVRKLWDATTDKYGKVDIWVNNAGLSTSRKPLWELDPTEIDDVVGLNLRGTLHASAVVLDAMLAQGHGALWNMEGLGSNGQIVPGLTVYGATKRAVTYATLALAKELKDTQVKVGLLSPGMVVTDLLTRDYEPAELEKAKKIFNILADRVETVTPWLAREVLKGTKNGGRVAWLTNRKAAYRFATAAFTKRDVFARNENGKES
ncbi:NAD(P)-dependent dehydrogenase (short-subunit alcohol dehydrogenase family) [Actinoplanes lutulentus]|uniref:NADP-dependent 3-hydroxy acid dehydrogenase YdfG n=1 Tax=Actinoplanes lutulentus TaxID=1287878 RepID=A0A327ZHE3_9ACTN|nr:SDR family oxidoreductase [Actinoplanes lutulentus]MBB2944411.1 NAD(P)-dependent dehydrogenase (short-subunit alcohol dehydrogenase family) [Actinoplanes lutulentus]RAK42357.1 NADP-dependent 3-hydroxy acid dehydrogenase YdfG [Actinoplanes lutulentus]